jgi:aminobenzoyl-glutamate utilization protein B
VAHPELAQPEGGHRYPSWVRHAMGGVPACIDPMWTRAGEVIAATVIDLMLDPAGLSKARSEFEERTGGGIGGSKWVAPLLPPDFVAPTGYRWPEYVETPRGREWTVPAVREW